MTSEGKQEQSGPVKVSGGHPYSETLSDHVRKLGSAMFTMEKHLRHIILQWNLSSQDSMSVTIRFKSKKFIKNAFHTCVSARCRQISSGWVLGGGECRKVKIFTFHLLFYAIPCFWKCFYHKLLLLLSHIFTTSYITHTEEGTTRMFAAQIIIVQWVPMWPALRSRCKDRPRAPGWLSRSQSPPCSSKWSLSWPVWSSLPCSSL